MRNNDTGEFELVIGNRQLLSGFFIVVLLFAVAFAMGYVVGQNSPRSSKLGETASVATPAPVPDASRPAPAASAPTEAPKPAETAAAAPPDTAAAPPAESEAPPQPTTQPARETAPAEAPAAAGPPQLAPGTYWQAIAVQQHEAEVMATGLKEKGLSVVLRPGTKGLTRVLVGPYNNKEALGRAKTELENAGLHPILYK